MSRANMKVICLPPQKDDKGNLLHTVQALINDELLAAVNFWSPHENNFPAKASGRTAVLTFLPLAMKLGLDIEVMDELDAISLDALNQWQEIMQVWHSSSLQKISIKAKSLDYSSSLKPLSSLNALMAFSGGVDSCHTLIRHSSIDSDSTIKVKSGLLVHGMDIPLADTTAFSGAVKRAKAMLSAHGAATLTIATDIRILERQFKLSWETLTHGIVLAACLSLFEKSFDAVLIASTYPADDLQLPWGSNPITDIFLGGLIPFIHDGVASNKRKKVAEIANDPAFASHLRVCWEGDRKDSNCGHCFKCLTTQACLWLAGVNEPAAFDKPTTVSDLKNINIKNKVNHNLILDMHEASKHIGRIDIADELAALLRRSKYNSAHKSKGFYFFLKNILQKFKVY